MAVLDWRVIIDRIKLSLKSNLCGYCAKLPINPDEGLLCTACEKQILLQSPTPLIQRSRYTVYAATGFSAKLKQRLYGYKFYYQTHQAGPLSEVLMHYWQLAQQAHQSNWVVMPIPSHQVTEKSFLSNLTRPFASQFGYTFMENALSWARPVQKQHEIYSRRRRKENMIAAFSCSEDALNRLAPSQPVLVVDDILTTGSTMMAALETLHHARPDLHLAGLTLTHVPMRGQH